MNDVIQDWINDPAGHIAFFDTFMKLSASDLIYATPLLLLALWFWPSRQRALNQRVAAATFFAILVSLGAAMLLGHLYREARPFVSDASTRLLISHGADNSFPSDHAAFAFAVGGVLIWWRRTLGLVCLGLATLTGIARIYVGVHWPLDVAASAGAGIAAGWALSRAVPLLETPQRWFSRVLPPVLVATPEPGS